MAVIVGSLAGGTTPLEIRAAYPQLSAEDIRAALSYAAELTHQDLLVPLPAKEAPVRVKVDEHLPKAAAELLRGRGLDAITVIEQGMGGSKGPVLWNAVRAEGRFLVTADKGFGDIRARPPGNHGGILLLRPEEAGVRTLVELLEDALAGFDLEVLAGTATVATARGIRIRHGGRVRGRFSATPTYRRGTSHVYLQVYTQYSLWVYLELAYRAETIVTIEPSAGSMSTTAKSLGSRGHRRRTDSSGYTYRDIRSLPLGEQYSAFWYTSWAFAACNMSPNLPSRGCKTSVWYSVRDCDQLGAFDGQSAPTHACRPQVEITPWATLSQACDFAPVMI